MRISDWSSDVCSSDLPMVTLLTHPTCPVTGEILCSWGGWYGRFGITLNRGWSAKGRSEEHTSELQSLMRISYAVFCLKKKKTDRKAEKHSTLIKRQHTKIR